MSNLTEEEIQIKEKAYLEKNVFLGLKNLNTGFDAKSIKYFSESDFELILQRVEEQGLGIYGIEPWLDGEYYDVLIYEDFKRHPKDPIWYNSAFLKFKEQNKFLQYAATYEIPLEFVVKNNEK